MPKKPKRPTVKVTWAEAFRDIIIRSIDRGQLLPVSVFLLLVLIIWKLESDQLEALVEKVIDLLVMWDLVGWLLFFFLLLTGIIGGFIVRSLVRREQHRIGKEKSRLQNQLHKKQLKSSQRK